MQPLNKPQDSLAKELKKGIAALQLSLTPAQCNGLLNYVQLLAKWNQVYNLTAVRDPADMISHHILDSLAVIPYIKGPHVLDVGTGAGLPGIPLAIALPDLDFVLLDSVAKKTRFILQAAGELRLSNVMVKTRRVEKFQSARLFDTVLSRAFSSLAKFAVAAGPLCRPGGVLLAMKGRYPQQELADLPEAYQVRDTVRLSVPGLEEERCIVCLSHYYSYEI